MFGFLFVCFLFVFCLFVCFNSKHVSQVVRCFQIIIFEVLCQMIAFSISDEGGQQQRLVTSTSLAIIASIV